MASIDLKDAYYSVPIHSQFQKYLKFKWKGATYQFVCFPNGLAICPQKFTKLLKPVFAHLRNQGHISVVFIDDSWLKSDQYNDCVANIVETLCLLDKLGFTIHPEKSVLTPTQKIVFLGFILDSVKMQVSLTPERAQKLIAACRDLLNTEYNIIRNVAKVLGLMTASFPGVMYGPLHYRELEMQKTYALKTNKGKFDAKMTLSQQSKDDIRWWITSIPASYNPVSHGEPQVTLSTDASLIGWGACMSTTSTGGNWSPLERNNDINYLEMLAVLFALKSFSSHIAHKHVRVLVDNTTAVSNIKHMGTCHSKANNMLVGNIWEWCIAHNVWLTAAHIPGKQNTIADKESRVVRRETEWSLNKVFFKTAVSQLGFQPEIDLFASRLNYQVKPYVAYTPDPEAHAIDAFQLTWTLLKFYAFPPFCLIQHVLHKIKEEHATGLIVVPHWPTQSWWPLLTNMLIQPPLLLPRQTNTLMLHADPSAIHPLHQKMGLLVCHLSGKASLTEAFQRELPKLSFNHGVKELKSNTVVTYTDGNSSVVKGRLIQFMQLSKLA